MTGKSDCQSLMDEASSLVDELLKANGAFHPLGFVLTKDRSISSLAFDLGSEVGTSQLLEFARDSYRESAATGDYIATALIYDAQVNDADTIVVELDHSDGYSVVVLKPYELVGENALYGALSAQQGSNAIFT